MAVREKLIEMLNKALELEHAARIQYLAHAELIGGLNAEPIVARLKEIASDEEKHEKMFRELLGSYLDAEPTMSMGPTYRANTTETILSVNIKNEKEALDFYKQIYRYAVENQKELPYSFERFEHELRHIIIDEEEHVAELSLLLDKSGFWENKKV